MRKWVLLLLFKRLYFSAYCQDLRFIIVLVCFTPFLVWADLRANSCNLSLSPKTSHTTLEISDGLLIDGSRATAHQFNQIRNNIDRWRSLINQQLLYLDQLSGIWLSFVIDGKTYFALLFHQQLNQTVFQLRLEAINSLGHLRSRKFKEYYSDHERITTIGSNIAWTWNLQEELSISNASVIRLVEMISQDYFTINQEQILFWDLGDRFIVINFGERISPSLHRYRLINSVALVEHLVPMGNFRVPGHVQKKISQKHKISREQLLRILELDQFRYLRDGSSKRKVYKSLISWRHGRKRNKIFRLVFRFATDQGPPILVTLFPLDSSSHAFTEEVAKFNQYARIFFFQKDLWGPQFVSTTSNSQTELSVANLKD